MGQSAVHKGGGGGEEEARRAQELLDGGRRAGTWADRRYGIALESESPLTRDRVCDRVRMWQAKEDPKLVDVLLNTKIFEDAAFKTELEKQILAIPFPEDDSEEED